MAKQLDSSLNVIRIIFRLTRQICRSMLCIIVVLIIHISTACDSHHRSDHNSSKHSHSHQEDLHPHPEIENLYIDMAAVEQRLDFHKSLTEAIWSPGLTASHMKDDDTVIGIVVEGQAYALPWWILKNHHIADLTLGDKQVVVLLCEMCGSGSAFEPIVGGKKLEFRQHGIYKSTWFMSDMETNSYWLPFEGRSFYGPMKDSILRNIDTYQLSWASWLEEYPETEVLYDSQSKRKGHGSREVLGYERIAPTYRKTAPEKISESLPMFDIILGVSDHHLHKAFSFRDLDDTGKVLMDSLGKETPLVVFHKPKSTLGGAFIPEVEGRALSFVEDENGKIVDEQTLSIWDYFGKCQSGELKDLQLASYFFIVKEWYGWYTYHPDTQVFARD